MKRLITILLPALFCMLASREALACAVCFGDPDSKMAQSAMAGVYLLGAVIVGLLIGIASLAVHWSLRARNLDRETQE